MRSSSGNTLLLKWYDDSGYRYAALDPSTLEPTREWSSSVGTPVVMAVADKELLGSMGPTPRDSEMANPRQKYDLFLRTLEGDWRRFPARLDVGHFGSPTAGMNGPFAPNHTAFLSDDLVAGEVSDPQGKTLLKVVRTDGTEVVSQKFGQEGELSVSPDGQYFGFVYISQSAFNQWLDKAIDMQFWPDMIELSLWKVSEPASIAKIALGRNVTDYCFAPGREFSTSMLES